MRFTSYPPQLHVTAGFLPRLAAFYAALFLSIGIQMPFFPVWLAAKGLDPQTIGLILAVPMLVRMVAVPLVTRQADRTNSLRGAILISSVTAFIGYAALGMSEGVATIFSVFALACVASTPVMPLADAYALRGLAEHGGFYGPVRVWGSAAFIGGNFIAGLLLDAIAPRHLIWLIVAAMAVGVVAGRMLAPLAQGGVIPRERRPSIGALLRDRRLIFVVGAASLIQASHAVYYGFSTIDWSGAGLDGPAIAALWALGVLAEIALFSLSARLELSPTALLSLGAGGAAVRWTVMGLAPPFALLPILQCLHAFSFGATHLGTLAFLARAVPAGLGATAQGYLAIALGLVMAASMALSGVLYVGYGGRAYLAMAAMAVVGAGLTLAVHRLRPGDGA